MRQIHLAFPPSHTLSIPIGDTIFSAAVQVSRSKTCPPGFQVNGESSQPAIQTANRLAIPFFDHGGCRTNIEVVAGLHVVRVYCSSFGHLPSRVGRKPCIDDSALLHSQSILGDSSTLTGAASGEVSPDDRPFGRQDLDGSGWRDHPAFWRRGPRLQDASSARRETGDLWRILVAWPGPWDGPWTSK